MGDGGGSSEPTLQQQQLETAQALTSANLNLEENATRKSLLNSMMGTRVFRGSALSRALRGNTPGTGGEQGAGPASRAQLSTGALPVVPNQKSLLDQRESNASGATSAGGAGSSASPGLGGGYGGGGSGRGVGAQR